MFFLYHLIIKGNFWARPEIRFGGKLCTYLYGGKNHFGCRVEATEEISVGWWTFYLSQTYGT